MDAGGRLRIVKNAGVEQALRFGRLTKPVLLSGNQRGTGKKFAQNLL